MAERSLFDREDTPADRLVVIPEGLTYTPPIEPDNLVLMPRELTAENGAKAALSGEFHETIEVQDPEDDDAFVDQDVQVSWDTIKEDLSSGGRSLSRRRRCRVYLRRWRS